MMGASCEDSGNGETVGVGGWGTESAARESWATGSVVFSGGACSTGRDRLCSSSSRGVGGNGARPSTVGVRGSICRDADFVLERNDLGVSPAAGADRWVVVSGFVGSVGVTIATFHVKEAV